MVLNIHSARICSIFPSGSGELRKESAKMTTQKKKVPQNAPELTEDNKTFKPYKCQMFLKYYGP